MRFFNSLVIIIMCSQFSFLYADTGFGVSSVGTLSSITGAELSVEPVEIDLESHIPGYSFSSSFTITNLGGETLTGTISETVDWITSLNPASFSLNYNESDTVEFSGSFPDETGEFSTNISITSNGGNQEVLVYGSIKLGSISGYVFYDDIAIADQKVGLYSVTDAKLQLDHFSYTDIDGKFTFNNLEDGYYDVLPLEWSNEYIFSFQDFTGLVNIIDGNRINDYKIYLIHEIKYSNPFKYSSSPVYIEWESKVNESKYIYEIYDYNFNISTNHTTNNNISVNLDPGYYYFTIESYSTHSELHNFRVGLGAFTEFKVDISVISDPGTISSNTTWSGEVYLTDDVIVEEGVTLTIEPGTIIYINKNVIAQLGGISIHVYGNIISQGTEDKPIKFVPHPDLNLIYPFIWNGIILHENAQGTLRNNYISNTYTGVQIWDSSPVIHHSIFNKTYIGIDIHGNNANPDIQYNDLFSQGYDLYISSSDVTNPTIQNNNFYSYILYSGKGVSYVNSAENHQLDCRYNYWGVAEQSILDDLHYEGTILYSPAYDDPVSSNSWSAEIVDWDLPYWFENPYNVFKNNIKLEKTTENQDSVLMNLLSNTLGPKDDFYLSLGYGGYVIFDLGINNSVKDSAGADIYIYESIANDTTITGSENEAAAILLSNSADGPWELAAEISSSAAIDIDSLSENQYRYLKIQDISLGDSTITSPGFDLDAIRIKNNVTITGLNDDNQFNYASEFILKQNYPNPFNPSTNIIFNIPKPSDVKIEVFNSLGQKVSVIINKKMNAGIHTVKFDAGNLSSGIYYYKIKAGEFIAVKKMLLMR